MNSHILSVALDKAFRLINHGPTVLVSAGFNGVENVMTAAWVCALDFDPPKLTLVLDKSTATRTLLEQSGEFVVQVPNVAQIKMTHDVGSMSHADAPDKLAQCGVSLFRMTDSALPFVEGCSAWLACRLLPESRNQAQYDLFIAEVTGAWADDRIFRDGHWQFEQADPKWRSLHHVSGGHFYAIGEALAVPQDAG